MKASKLKGIAVVDVDTAQKIGSVTDVILDPKNLRVAGLEVKKGAFSSTHLLSTEKVRSFGQDAVTVDGESSIGGKEILEGIDSPEKFSSMTGTKIVTQSGRFVGRIDDVLISDDGLRIEGYEYSKGGIGSLVGLGSRQLAATPDQRYGGSLLVVPESVPAAE